MHCFGLVAIIQSKSLIDLITDFVLGLQILDMPPTLGKSVAQYTYLHISALGQVAPNFQELVSTASVIAGITDQCEFNVIKISADFKHLTLLDYPGFFDDPFPVLRRFWSVDLENRKRLYRTYENSLNPPILHRKELLLADIHPQKDAFSALSRTAEQIGLFDDSNRIGFKRSWESLLTQRGYRLVGHEFLPIGNDESDTPINDELTSIARHRTALTRYGFSAPVQTLARFGFMDGSKTVFDYGCGRGDDIRGLRENGIEAAGWDPYYAPDEPQRGAHIVNLGFVINVIENVDERKDALRGAFALTSELLVVSAMLANQETIPGKPYGDGILTSRNTFQRYYTQSELQAFISEVLDEEPLPVSPGIFFIFKDKDVEQRFMYGRLENRRNISWLSHISRSEKPGRPAKRDKTEEKYLQNRDLLEALWEICLTLGRDPDRSEIPVDQTNKPPIPEIELQSEGHSHKPTLTHSAITANFGSLPTALRFIKSRKDDAEAVLKQARQSRIEDLQVYFSQLQFERRKLYQHLDSRLQKDVKAFFGDFRTALNSGREFLFTAGKPENIAAACYEASEHGIGWLEESESLTLPTELIVQLPSVLRTYVSCGLRIYGDATSSDLIKIHIRSGKLTLMSFDNFIGLPLPRMTQRVKIKLREQDLDIFDYGETYESPYLYRKSRYINEEFPYYAEQLAFDDALLAAGLLDFNDFGPKPGDFDSRLAKARWQIDGFQLVRSRNIPALDSPCGRYFTYRKLIECGETQVRTGLPNLPKEPGSYNALYELATKILDPLIDYYGMIKLTYGFCSPELSRYIKGRVAPKLDQHAAHELNRVGKPVCPRLGAAVDFIVEDEDMKEVAYWIMANLTFDRLYFYGPDRPIHISYSAAANAEAWELRLLCNGKIVPRPFKLAPEITSNDG